MPNQIFKLILRGVPDGAGAAFQIPLGLRPTGTPGSNPPTPDSESLVAGYYGIGNGISGFEYANKLSGAGIGNKVTGRAMLGNSETYTKANETIGETSGALAGDGEIYHIGGIKQYMGSGGFSNYYGSILTQNRNSPHSIDTEALFTIESGLSVPISARSDTLAIAGPDGFIYFFGGDRHPANIVFDDIHVFRPHSIRGTLPLCDRVGTLPTGRSNMTGGLSSNKKMYLFGETSGGGSFGAAHGKKIVEFNPANYAVTVEATEMPERLYAVRCAAVGHLMILVGGQIPNTGAPNEKVYAFNTITKSVTAIITCTPGSTTLYPCVVTGADGFVYEFGGTDIATNTISTKLWRINPYNNTRTQIGNVPFQVTQACATLSNDGFVFVYGTKIGNDDKVYVIRPQDWDREGWNGEFTYEIASQPNRRVSIPTKTFGDEGWYIANIQNGYSTQTFYSAPSSATAPRRYFMTQKADGRFTYFLTNAVSAFTRYYMTTRTGAGQFATTTYSSPAAPVTVCPPGPISTLFVTEGEEGENGNCDCEDEGAPDVPAAPTITRSCSEKKLIISSGAFAEGVTRMRLRKSIDGGVNWKIVYNFNSAGSWDDVNVESPGEYLYQLSACSGDELCSAFSPSATGSLTSSIVPAWESPEDGDTVNGQVLLIATAGPRTGLHINTPISMKLFGAPLAVTYQPLRNRFVAKLDTSLEYQGELKISLQARDAGGCYSNPVWLTLNLNNSIERKTRWSEICIELSFSAQLAAQGNKISEVGYFPFVDARGPVSAQNWYRWYVVSPDPGATTTEQRDDNTFMRQHVRNWQTIAPDEIVPLSVPSASARLAMESIPNELMSLYDLQASRVIKTRQFVDSEIEIVTSHNYSTWNDEGLKIVARWSDFEKPGLAISGNVRDAVKLGSKIYLVRESAPNLIVVIDLTQGKVTNEMAPYGEKREIRGVERVEDKPLAIFGNDGNGESNGSATGYLFESSVDDPFVVEYAVNKSWVRDGRLLLSVGPTYATAHHVLEVTLSGSDGATLETIHEHDSLISAVGVFEDEGEAVLEIGDVQDRAYRVQGETSTLLASGLGGDVSDMGRWKGASARVRDLLIVKNGPSASKLFINEGNGYLPLWSLKDLEDALATEAVSLNRVLTEIIEAKGDPLKGGDAGLDSESLTVTFNTSNGAFLARLQQADVDTSKTTRARAITDHVFKAVRFK